MADRSENTPVDNGPLDIVARLRTKANWPLTGWDLSLLLGDAADEIDSLRTELARFKRYTKAEYRLVSADGGIAISFPVHERDARQRALEWHEWHPAYAIELVTSECWGTDWEVVDRQAVQP